VQAGDVLRVEKLAATAGETIQFNDILMLGGDTLTVGSPLVAGAAVQAEVIDQIKGVKVIHYVKRRRKHSSQRTKGHRQHLTLVRVTGILASGAESTGVAVATGTAHARRAAHNADAAPAPAAPAEAAAKPKRAPRAAAAAKE
jgi:large subunit ribosomal protein L21